MQRVCLRTVAPFSSLVLSCPSTAVPLRTIDPRSALSRRPTEPPAWFKGLLEAKLLTEVREGEGGKAKQPSHPLLHSHTLALSLTRTYTLTHFLLLSPPLDLPSQVHDYSKRVFGVCGLLPDMVRAVPVWIDDPKVQKALYVNVLLREVTGDAATRVPITAGERLRRGGWAGQACLSPFSASLSILLSSLPPRLSSCPTDHLSISKARSAPFPLGFPLARVFPQAPRNSSARISRSGRSTTRERPRPWPPTAPR
jgi:hypothetical protein